MASPRSIAAGLKRLSRPAGTLLRRICQFRSRNDCSYFVNYVFQHVLGRKADPAGLEYFVTALQKGQPFSNIVREIEASPEAQARRRRSSIGLDRLSDGEFILNIAELLFQGRSATAKDIECYRRFLNDDRTKRHELVQRLISEHVMRESEQVPQLHNPGCCWIMGTDRYLDLATWRQKASELALASPAAPLSHGPSLRSAFRHSDQYVVSAIASLYKGQRFIRQFLDNMASQTIFDRTELLIIDADSPEDEARVIAAYQERYPNIVYKRINYRIGVYDAWNVAVRMARGRYLTSTNVDDLRDSDSLERQAAALDRHGFADVVYQDFFYSFDPFLSFPEIARFGFKTELPIITANNLLSFNSPHNAPMWRVSLHDEVGLFDTSYKSAGDWDFWLRCVSNGKRFFKLNTPHVAYYQNPDGVSTHPNTTGIEEARAVLRRYGRRLISPRHVLTRQSFSEMIGRKVEEESYVSYYDLVQTQLRVHGDRYKAGANTRGGLAGMSGS
jgi:glycosyltransferase involved in cell wall biosynthesis